MKLIIYSRGDVNEGDAPVIMNTLEEIESFYTETFVYDEYDDIMIHIRCKDGRCENIVFNPQFDSIMIIE